MADKFINFSSLLHKVVMQICRKILWLLVFLAIILFTCAHGTLVLLATIKLDNANDQEQLSEFDQTLKFLWFGFLGDYSFLSPWPKNFWLDIGRITFSFFTSIVILNILSTYLQICFFRTLAVSFLTLHCFFGSCACK
jgi:hypothetical protein